MKKKSNFHVIKGTCKIEHVNWKASETTHVHTCSAATVLVIQIVASLVTWVAIV